MKTILMVEDDKTLGSSLQRALIAEGYKVIWAQTGKEGRSYLPQKPSLILLDWALPDIQGLDFIRDLRANQASLPIILLTARADLVDKVVGLEAGANDYVTKPFEPKELFARIRVQLRASPAQPSPAETLTLEGVCIRDDLKEVTYKSQPVELTKLEYLLLKLLAENPNHVFSRDEILNKVWGYDQFPSTRTVDNHILQLRQKLPGIALETLRGMGYRWKVTKK